MADAKLLLGISGFVYSTGTEVVHKYVVANEGPWRVNYVDVDILWPHQVGTDSEDPKYLLYLVEEPLVEGGPSMLTKK